MDAKNGNGAVGGADRPLRSRGEIESAISRSFIQLEKACTGRGPEETRTYLIDDLVVVRLRGVMTPAEMKLAEAEQRGAYLIKQARSELMNVKRTEVEEFILDLLGVGVRSVHSDMSTRTGERVVVLSLDGRPRVRAE